jgi:hypothetical protein
MSCGLFPPPLPDFFSTMSNDQGESDPHEMRSCKIMAPGVKGWGSECVLSYEHS